MAGIISSGVVEGLRVKVFYFFQFLFYLFIYLFIYSSIYLFISTTLHLLPLHKLR